MLEFWESKRVENLVRRKKKRNKMKDAKVDG